MESYNIITNGVCPTQESFYTLIEKVGDPSYLGGWDSLYYSVGIIMTYGLGIVAVTGIGIGIYQLIDTVCTHYREVHDIHQKMFKEKGRS